jgi:glycosyltransferase involved in cell wall biosynthesis
MRLLITFGTYHPSIGGAEEVCRRLAEEMVQRGHQVTVATSTHPEREEDTHNGVRIVPFDIRGNWALDMHGDLEGYQRLLMAGDFDVSLHYAAQTWTTDLVLPLLNRLPAPAVLAPRGYSGLRDPRYARYFARLKHVLPGFAALVHHSEVYRDAQYAVDADFPRSRSFTIPNGTDAAEFEQAKPGFRKVLGIDNRPLVLTVSAHTGGKGHEMAIRAFQSVAPKDAVFVIVGNDSPGGCLDRCRSHSQEDLRVLILEELPRELVVQAFLESDIFLLASDVEAAPLVILEAMTAGLPWLSTPVGNVKELAGGIVADASRFAERLDLLFKNDRLRQELSDQGRRWAKAHARLPHIHDQYEALFKRIVAGELRGAPVPAELFAVDMDRKQGLEAVVSGNWEVAIPHLTQSLDRDPTREGLRLPLLTSILKSGQDTSLPRIYEMVKDEVELTPRRIQPNKLLFLLGGALEQDLDLQEAEERAVALRLPKDQLRGLATRGQELRSQGDDAVREAVQEALLSLLSS